MSLKQNSPSILQKTFIQSQVNILKPKQAVQLPETTTLAEVIETLHVKNIGCVLLNDERGELSGIFSERDLVTKQLCCIDKVASKPIAEFMTRSPQFLKSNASIARALHLMAIGGFRHIPIVPVKTGATQIISSTDLFRYIHEQLTSKILREDTRLFFDTNAVDQFFISDLSIFKLSKPLIVNADDRIVTAAKEMTRTKQSACFVISEKGCVKGLFTERDYLRKVAITTSGPSELSVEKVMTTSPLSLMSSSSVAYAFGSLVDGGFRNLPIVDISESLIGVIGVRHFIDYLAQQIIAVLEAQEH